MKQQSTTWQLGLHVLILLALIVNLGLIFDGKYGEEPVFSADYGQLKITFLNAPDCDKCFDLEPFKEYFEQNGVEEDQFVEVDYTSRQGKKLVKKYEVSKVPTVIIHGDIAGYEFLISLVEAIAEQKENAYLVTKVQPPYYDIGEEKIRGEFEIIYIKDEACEECYDVALHEQVFERLGLNPSNSSNLDISSEEGKLAVESYDLLAVPTILLRGDLEPYENLSDIWGEVGSIEEDGTYVLRDGVSSMGIYKQLPEGTIINPQENADIE